MRRITAVITAMVTAGSLLASHEANQSGVTGKAGDRGEAGTHHTGRPGVGPGGADVGKAGERK